ncbi:hypothetical protein [Pseudomonas sp. LS-2]|jgi:hypothetical protein|uniref:hypothetical protein n=1 Tax=Pseudomonas sp. LS-2 TaxID=2315859 RepID=UPI000E76FBE5|nr:hypothetical protein [Pseudomonas sp. LS-2]RJX81252.1 hypothetical protein D3M70_08900 [Pseudomonas sp. LS-2]
MSLETRIIGLAQAIGTDIKTLTAKQGDLTSLSTTAKGNLVAAINELYGLLGSSGAVIDDTAGDGATAVTWSANKIFDSIEAAKVAVQNSILGGASAAYDTLKELQDLIVADDGLLTALTTAVANRVRFDDVQTLNTAQKLQACTNIGIGNPESDFAASYATAKA